MTEYALLVMTDGRRDCITRAIPSALSELDPAPSELWIHDDSGDPEYREFLRELYPRELGWWIVGPPEGRSGFGGAIRSAWSYLREQSKAPWVFHLEDDFTFTRRVPVADMAEVLTGRPDLVQLALRRQPWNDHERLAGGIVEQHPDAYADLVDEAGREWLEHRLFFTTNPGLYRRALLADREWPTGTESEGRFSHELLGDDRTRFGFYGSRSSGEAVHHIGDTRMGIGY